MEVGRARVRGDQARREGVEFANTPPAMAGGARSTLSAATMINFFGNTLKGRSAFFLVHEAARAGIPLRVVPVHGIFRLRPVINRSVSKSLVTVCSHRRLFRKKSRLDDVVQSDILDPCNNPSAGGSIACGRCIGRGHEPRPSAFMNYDPDAVKLLSQAPYQLDRGYQIDRLGSLPPTTLFGLKRDILFRDIICVSEFL